MNDENNENCDDGYDYKWINEIDEVMNDDIIHILCEYIKIDWSDWLDCWRIESCDWRWMMIPIWNVFVKCPCLDESG